MYFGKRYAMGERKIIPCLEPITVSAGIVTKLSHATMRKTK